MESDKITKKIFSIFILLVLALSLIPAVSASYDGAYNVKISKNYVMAKAKCSCGLSSWARTHTMVFKNYCPNCHHKNALYYEEGTYYGYNRGTSPEGLWACGVCDMDFCAKDGKSHDNRGYFLIPYSGIAGNYTVEDGYITGKVQPKPVVQKPAPKPPMHVLFDQWLSQHPTTLLVK